MSAQKNVGKTCNGATLRGITPTLTLISRMAPDTLPCVRMQCTPAKNANPAPLAEIGRVTIQDLGTLINSIILHCLYIFIVFYTSCNVHVKCYHTHHHHRIISARALCSTEKEQCYNLYVKKTVLDITFL